MRLLLDQELSAEPESCALPKVVETRFNLHCIDGPTQVDVHYWLAPDLPVWFEVDGTRTKTAWVRSVTVQAESTPVDASLSLVWGPGEAFPAGSLLRLHAIAQEIDEGDPLSTSKRVTITNAPAVSEASIALDTRRPTQVVTLALPAPAAGPKRKAQNRRGKGK